MMFDLNVRDDNDDVLAYVTLAMIHVRVIIIMLLVLFVCGGATL